MVSNSDESFRLKKPGNQDANENGESLFNSLGEVDKAISAQGSVISRANGTANLALISLERDEQGLGFNIVGGTDSPHIPGHNGIFVSIIKSDGPAFNDGRLSVGDLIMSINGIELVNKSHDEAVCIFRSQTGSPVELLVEIGAENRILNLEHITPQELLTTDTTDTHLCAGKSPIIENSDLRRSSLRSHGRHSHGDGFSLSTPSPSNVHGMKGREEDSESVGSCTPSVHSYLDDVPRTPKRPMSYLDPRNPSIFTEVLYVSIGLAVISLGIYVGYRIVRARR